jgi:hypothetical protein
LRAPRPAKTLLAWPNKFSEDPGSKNTGGLYENFPKGQMVKPFEDAAFTLPIGSLSDIVETPYGYHILKIIDRKKETKPYEEVKKDLEEEQETFLEKARKNDIALFVPGDPLIATTHIDLVFEAKRRKIPVKIIHNASIFSAIGEAGLQIYKFGKTATVPMNGKMENQ